MSIIETATSLRPGIADTPLDARCRVNTLAEISTIELPYVGQIIYCIETDRYYKVTALKPRLIGALTVPDAAIDNYEAIPVTTAEIEDLFLKGSW